MKRTYEKTHPWIDFRFDLAKAPSRFWYLIGQAVARALHASFVLLPPTERAQLERIYLAQGIAATVAIEGNPATVDDVLRLQDEGTLGLPPSRQYQEQEIRNIHELYAEIRKCRSWSQLPPVDVETILSYNRTILKGVDSKEGHSPAGKFREHEVTVGQYRGAPKEDLQYLTNQLCKWLHSYFKPLREYGPTAYGLVRAVMAHLYIAWIHPFADGNGRTARAIEMHLLRGSGIPTFAAQLLSNHYNETRDQYYHHLSRARHQKDAMPFVVYSLQGFVDQIHAQNYRIQRIQHKLLWEHFVHEQFSGKRGEPNRRQRQLVLDISRQYDFVPIEKIPELSPELIRAYATKSRKTLRRDINALKNMELWHSETMRDDLDREFLTGLIEETPIGIRTREELILSLMPEFTSIKEA